jgi:hypothetical protein
LAGRAIEDVEEAVAVGEQHDLPRLAANREVGEHGICVIDAVAVRRDAVWSGEVVEHVRNLYDAWNWRSMHSGSLNVVRAVENVSLESLGSNEHFMLVLRNPREGAVVRLRPTGPLAGVLVDALTGQTLRSLHYDAASGMRAIELPHDSKLLLLAMRADSSR